MKEIDIYNSKKDLKFLSGRFAAKEAILKCLGTGMQDGIALSDKKTPYIFQGYCRVL